MEHTGEGKLEQRHKPLRQRGTALKRAHSPGLPPQQSQKRSRAASPDTCSKVSEGDNAWLRGVVVGRIVKLPPRDHIPDDSIVHRQVRGDPYDHPFVIRSVDDGIATGFVGTSFGATAIQDKWSHEADTVLRHRYLLIAHRQSTPHDGLPVLKLATDLTQLAKRTYIKVDEVLRIELSNLRPLVHKNESKLCLDAASLKTMIEYSKQLPPPPKSRRSSPTSSPKYGRDRHGRPTGSDDRMAQKWWRRAEGPVAVGCVAA